MNKTIINSILLSMIMIGCCALTTTAAKSPIKIRTIDPVAIKVMDYAFPDEYDFSVTTNPQPRSLDRSSNSIGFGYSVGTTFYDYQHNSSMHRQIEWGESEACSWTLHLTWMMLPSGVLADRSQDYNGWDGVGGSAVGWYPLPPVGEYGGYGSLDVTDDNRFVIVSHLNKGEGYRLHTYYQSSCNVPFYSAEMRLTDSLNDLGTTCPNPGDDEVIWPSIAVQNPPDGDRVLHLIGSAFCGGGSGANFSYYQAVGAEGDISSWTQGFVIDTIQEGECYDLCADETGNVAITWVANPPADGDPCDTCSANGELSSNARNRWENDLYVQINRNFGRGIYGSLFDGTTNFWENRVNITKNVEGSDGFRPQADLISMFDLSGVYHTAYVAMVWDDSEPGTYQSRIFHWQEGYSPGYLRTVATAQWDPVNCNPGAFNLNQAKLSITECDNKFYVTWVELNSPHTTGNQNQDDCAQRAFDGDFTGAANGDLFISVSDDGGLTWVAPRALTDTYGGPTGNPDGACDPAGPAGPCPSEHWMSATTQGSNYPIAGPTPDNVVNVYPGYVGSYYFDLAYIDDPEPGGAVFSYGAWYAADYKWIRIPCYAPLYAPSYNCGGGFHFPDIVHHCQERRIEYMFENIGNAPLTYSYLVEEDPSAYSNWLGTSGFTGSVPSGTANVEVSQILINWNGTVCDPGTVVRTTGRVKFFTNVPDTCIFEVDMIVADTLHIPNWDSVTTLCGLQLAVGNNGNMGNQGSPGQGMDYSFAGSGEWRPDDYNTYMYDGGQVIGWVDDATGDTVVNWGLFQMTITDSVALMPQGGQSHSSTSWADISYSGEYTTNDTSIGMSSKWYAPIDVGLSCNFVIKETRIYSKSGSKSGLMIGEIIDWDVPGDSTGRNNSSGSTSTGAYSVIYQQGIEMPGYDDSLEAADGGWDNDQRFGAIMYLGGMKLSGAGDTTKISDDPHGMFSVDNLSYVYPFELGLDGALLYQLMSSGGSSLSDSIGDLNSGVSYVFDYDLAFGDTLVFFTAYVTTMNSSVPAEGLAGVLSDVAEFVCSNSWWCYFGPCCDIAGDVDCNDTVDITDLTYTVDFMFRGGPPPCCQSGADVNNDGSTDISDLTYRVDFMFNGGPSLVCGSID